MSHPLAGPGPGTSLPAFPPAIADQIAAQVAPLLAAADRCEDPMRLRAALRVLAVALPELLVTTEPAEAVVATARAALDGTWP